MLQNEDLKHIPMDVVLDTIMDGLIIIDVHGLIQGMNKTAESMFQYTSEELAGKNISHLMPEPFASEHNEYIRSYLKSGKHTILANVRGVNAKRKDGSTFPIELGVNEMFVKNQRMFIGTIRDVSDRYEAEMSIKKYIRQLKRSNEELDEFAYIASHDLKEPLRGLSNNAEFLYEDYEETLGEDGKRRLDRIQYLCHRLESLVDDLLYFSRLGRQELAIQRVSLSYLVEDIKTLMEGTLEKEHVNIVIDPSLGEVICDVPRITEVLRNLIVNAIKYNDKPHKEITIGESETKNPNGKLVRAIYVKDNGIGIDPQFYEDVFRIFKRLNHEDDDTKGTGVGLTFVKKIIDRHHGQIWLTSELGQGTTFYFTLNLNEDGA
jgi:PAS domain S-box-containing protein